MRDLRVLQLPPGEGEFPLRSDRRILRIDCHWRVSWIVRAQFGLGPGGHTLADGRPDPASASDRPCGHDADGRRTRRGLWTSLMTSSSFQCAERRPLQFISGLFLWMHSDLVELCLLSSISFAYTLLDHKHRAVSESHINRTHREGVLGVDYGINRTCF